MSLTVVLLLAAAAALLRLVFPGRARKWGFMVASIFLLYYLQPASIVRGLDFWLPTATLFLVIFSWLLTTPEQERSWRQIVLGVGVMVAIVLLIAATRWFSVTGVITPSRPPELGWVALVLGTVTGLIYLVTKVSKPLQINFTLMWVIVLTIFVTLKLPALNSWISGVLSGKAAISGTIQWLGFSYIAFRVLHTVRDRQAGRLAQLGLVEYIDYCIFFPAVVAGPIDRVERFSADTTHPVSMTGEDFAEGGKRLAVGLFKKFFVADSLSLIALNATSAQQAHSAGWSWFLLYAYAFQILFDFSGYTDIAIGMGRWLGIKLPENFDRPYSKQNLTLFWNSWHMTLSQWFRAYFFNPITRRLRSASRKLAPWQIILIGQAGTMLLIGLWHGITLNFLIWGGWHALGLFVHSRWSEWMKPREAWFEARRSARIARRVFGVLLTFHYVALGWVWFALPDPQVATRVFLKLFGAGA